VSYFKITSKWCVQRWSQNENKKFSNGYYNDEETAAHASDTLARKLMENGEQNHKLNFPDDHSEVHPKKDKRFTSKFIGVSYFERDSNWNVQRWSKAENKTVFNGCYDYEETAAHASDTLARKLMNNGELNHRLNFSDDHIEVYPGKYKRSASKFFGVSYKKENSKWNGRRWSKDEHAEFTTDGTMMKKQRLIQVTLWQEN